MRRSEEIDLREGLVYDPQVKGFDSSFWKGDTANAGFDTVSNSIRIGDTGLVGGISSYSQYLYGDFEFKVRTDTLSPDSNDSEKLWGLLNIGDTLRRGASFFQAAYDTNTDTTTTRQLWATHVDEWGTRQRKRIPWDSSWDSTGPRYRITWESDNLQFLINDTVYATLGDKPDSSNSVFNINTQIPQAIRLSNRSLDTSDTQPMRLQLLTIRNARKVI